MIEFPWENGEKPEFINEEGVEWYKDKHLTQYSIRDSVYGKDKPLKNVIVWYIRKKIDGGEYYQSRVIINHTTDKILYESTSLEAMATHIDILRVIEGWDK